MRARRKVSGAGALRPDTPPRRQDDGRSSGSPAAGAARSKPSPAAGASLTPTKGRGPVAEQPSGGKSDGSATRARETQGHPPPLAGNALSSAYDHVPMPTSSLEFHHSMGGDDLFSSLEDQLSDPALRGVSPSVASPLRRSSRSSSITSPTRANFVASPAKAGGAGRTAAVVTAPAASVNSNFSSSERAPTTTLDTPETTRVAGVLGSGIAPMDGGRARWEEEQDNDLKKATESKRKAPSSPLPPPPPPPPPPPRPAAPEEPPAPSTDADAPPVEGVGLSTVSSPSTFRRQADVAAYSPALGVPTVDGGVERNETTDESPEARTVGGDSAKQHSTMSSTVGGEDGAPCTEEEEAASSPTSERVDLPAAGCADGGALRQEMEAGPESGSHDATAERKGGAEVEEEEEERAPVDGEGEKEGREVKENGESAGEENPCGLTKSSSPRRNTWYKEGTMVILDCPQQAKTGANHPSVPIADLLGRLVSVTSGYYCYGARIFLGYL